MSDFIGRVGTFFFVIGFGMFILFVASDWANAPQFDYLCIAMLAIGVGWMFQRRRPPPASAGRFSFVRKARENVRKRHQEKNKPAEREKPQPPEVG